MRENFVGKKNYTHTLFLCLFFHQILNNSQIERTLLIRFKAIFFVCFVVYDIIL